MTPRRPDDATSVTLVASVHPLQCEAMVTALEQHTPALLVVRHELGAVQRDGTMHRVVRHEGQEVERVVEVDLTCCLSCQVREDVLRAVEELRGRAPIVVVLPPTIEVGSVATELDRVADVAVDLVAAVVDPARVERDLTVLQQLAHADGGGASGSVGWELAHLLRTCDAVLRPPADARATAVVEALAGDATHATSTSPWWVGRRRHSPERLRRRRWPGARTPAITFDRDGVQTRTWTARRPFHPERLARLLDEHAFAEALHVHGHCWVATRQATVLSLDALGDHTVIGVAGVWQDALDARGFAVLEAHEWHPYYGDRNHQLQVTTVDHWGEWLVDALDDALVTDAELAEGSDGWSSWDDPFEQWLSDERELVARHRRRHG